jgi:hypothetical protein
MLSKSINTNLESGAVAEGGEVGDVEIFTDLITPENIKDLIDRNIINTLAYANRKANQIIVYIPVSKIPNSLLSNNLDKVTEQISLPDLLKEFNVSGITQEMIERVSYFGIWAWMLFVSTVIISVLLIFLMYLLTSAGKRLLVPGIALVLSGATTLAVVFLGKAILSAWINGISDSQNLGSSIIKIIIPPIIFEVLVTWSIYAVMALIFGVILFFIKKQEYNIQK